MTTKSLILVRHAQSEHHVKRLSGGWTDTPITELGHQQAHRVAQRLKSELGDAPIRLYTSDLLRTRNTAQHIAEAFQVEPIADARLREINNGEAAGLSIEEALLRWPEADGPWGLDHRKWPGGETLREFCARAGDFIETFDFEGPLAVVVTHGGTVGVLVRKWLGFAPEWFELVSLAAHVTGVTVLTHTRDGRPGVERLNDVSHLVGMGGWVSLGEALG